MLRFRDALLRSIERAGVSLAEVARGSGVSYEQIKKIGQRQDGSTNVEAAVAIAHYFGMTLDEFLEDHTAEDRRQIFELYSRLTARERDLLRATAAGLDAQDQAADQE